MRDLRLVTQPEFNSYIAAHPGLTIVTKDNGLVAYADQSNGAAWPDSLVASYTSAVPPKRPRPSGWRIPVED